MGIILCTLVSVSMILFYFCVGGGVLGYGWVSIIPYVWDTGISDEVYGIGIGICDIIYLILFVGWVCLWAWYIFSLRMRVRMVIRDRIPLSM